MGTDLITRLRAMNIAEKIAAPESETFAACLTEWQRAGVGFASSDPNMENQYYRAVRALFSAVRPIGSFGAILNKGGDDNGCWLESTGTIGAELLSRFLPEVAEHTFLGFAESQRADGLLPSRLTRDGAKFTQIQLVSPLARSVWNHYRLNRSDTDFLSRMYDAMSAYDTWIAENRDTRETGAVEAFCCFDTGHDLSARFWHIPDTPYLGDPTRFDPDNPLLPLIAPDLTANIACQRKYLAPIAAELGVTGTDWLDKSQASVVSLYAQCFDGDDRFFYDRDKAGRQVKIQSDVLLRVLACEIGNDAFFAESLEHYLLNTSKFFARYPFTSIALTDPRFDRAVDRNSWCGATNLLSLIRAPHAFEHHQRYVELNFALQPALSALIDMDRFAQTIDPFTGAPGFADASSPAALGLIDFIERISGILPRPDGTVWFTGLLPAALRQCEKACETAYSRTLDGTGFELVNSLDLVTVYKNGTELFRFPHGVRLVTSRDGMPVSLIGLSVSGVSGDFAGPDGTLAFRLGPNERLDFDNGKLVSAHPAGFVSISF